MSFSAKHHSSWLIPSMYWCLLLLHSGRTQHFKSSPPREGVHCMTALYFMCDSVHSLDWAILVKLLHKTVGNMKITFFHSPTMCHTVWSYLLPVLCQWEFTEPITSCQGSLTKELVDGFGWKMLSYSASLPPIIQQLESCKQPHHLGSSTSAEERFPHPDPLRPVCMVHCFKETPVRCNLLPINLNLYGWVNTA